MLSLLDNAVIQGLIYGAAVVGLVLSFRVARYPDLSADGSFLLGAVALAATLNAGAHWLAGLGLSIIAGVCVGGATAAMHYRFGVNKLLTGILASMAAYSLAFRLLGGRPNVGIADKLTVFTAAEDLDRVFGAAGSHPATVAVCALVVSGLVIAISRLLRSDVGLVMRGAGSNPDLVRNLGKTPERYTLLALCLGNGAVGLSGALVACHEGFVDINMGVGLIVMLIAALVIGEQCLRGAGLSLNQNQFLRLLAGLVGSVVYFLLYLAILRGSLAGWFPIRIEPTDLKILSAGVVLFTIVLRGRASSDAEQEEIIPF